MRVRRRGLASCGVWGLGLAALLAMSGVAAAQDLPLAPVHESGQGVTGSYEGWFPNQDGSFTLLLGYFNRNENEVLDIPVGPNNQIQPGGPDFGQPTHFLPHGRQWGNFTIKVPKDFGDKKLTWTLTANGKTAVIPLNFNPLYRLEPFVDATGNTPPYIGFSNEGPFVNGPIGQQESMTAKVGTPLNLTVYLADDAKDPMLRNSHPVVSVRWVEFRGPGAVKFENAAPKVETAKLDSPPPGTPFNGKAATTATFSAPGEYILNLQAEDQTGGGPAGRQCCWSNAKVKVTVAP
jgi:hypothetical protein